MDLIIKGRKRDIGGFEVTRSIPSAKKRFVGPFVFLDQMGPLSVDEKNYLDVLPHPHIGLSTVTYLLKGRGYHHDSLGYSQIIEPGDINLMTAGRGIVHSEKTPEEDKISSHENTIYGIQVWVALPVELEDCEPSFTHYPKENIPEFAVSKALRGSLMMGSFLEYKSPVKVYSPTLFMKLQSVDTCDEILSFKEEEIGIFLIEGEASINEEKLGKGDIIIVKDPQKVSLQCTPHTLLVVIGGETFPEPRYIWWNFVSSDKDKIKEAAKKWERQEMGKIEGETSYVPLPTQDINL